MKIMEEYFGKTPHGGVCTKVFFFDANDMPCEESKARKVQIIEYDKDNNAVFTIISECRI